MRILLRSTRLGTIVGAVALAAVALAACGDDEAPGAGPPAAGGGRVVVTTSILGDVVGAMVGDDAEVEVIMPAGTDPHDFAPSAQQAAAMRDADLLVVNGLGFEQGLASAIEGAADDGVVVYEAVAPVDTIGFGLGGRAHQPGSGDGHGDDDDGHGHDEDEHGHGDDDDGHEDDGHGHDHGDEDPHFFTDPARMAVAVDGLAVALATNVEGLDTEAFRERAAAYAQELRDLDAEVEALLAAVPEDRRVLITNHDVFGYFADRYGFEVLGAVIPGGSTLAEPSAADLAALARVMTDAGVPAVFAEVSAPARLAEALAGEVGHDVVVVELFTESLGEPGSGAETYPDLVRTNVARIVEALA